MVVQKRTNILNEVFNCIYSWCFLMIRKTHAFYTINKHKRNLRIKSNKYNIIYLYNFYK